MSGHEPPSGPNNSHPNIHVGTTFFLRNGLQGVVKSIRGDICMVVENGMPVMREYTIQQIEELQKKPNPRGPFRQKPEEADDIPQGATGNPYLVYLV